MASHTPPHSPREESSTANPAQSLNPGVTYAQVVSSNPPAAAGISQDPSEPSQPKKRKHRGGKKRRNRRQSFAAPPEPLETGDSVSEGRQNFLDVSNETAARSSFYRLQSNRSNTSLESEALLDHRDQGPLLARRQSIQGGMYVARPTQAFSRNSPHRPSQFQSVSQNRSKLSRQQRITDDEEEEEDDRTPLMASSHRDSLGWGGMDYGGLSVPSSAGRTVDRSLRRASISSTSSRRRRSGFVRQCSTQSLGEHDVNNPPSVPASPVLGPEVDYEDVMIGTELARGRSPDTKRSVGGQSRDALINIDADSAQASYPAATPLSPKDVHGEFRRRMTVLQAAEDVCFPREGMSELGQDDYMHRPEGGEPPSRRRRSRRWPDLSVLEEWSHEEKEQRTMEGIRARKVNEPLMVGGRLRPQKRVWHREADDAPYRFTYFNEEFHSTIHSQTISELVQPGQTFRDLFIPDPPLLSDDSSDDEEDESHTPQGRESTTADLNQPSANGHSITGTRQSSRMSDRNRDSSGEQTNTSTPAQLNTPKPKQKRYGPRPSFWLDVLSPTESEMRVISQAFGIHPLTSEDIMVQEAREKVELFRNYYFVNYRTFEQDSNNENYLEPVNMYVVVFREGVISFHFSMIPHPANVRRRIRQLSDYLILSPDWISYAIIDDITDVYAPLIQRIEEEVDEIDDAILCLHSPEEIEQAKAKAKNKKSGSRDDTEYEKMSNTSDVKSMDSGADMLRQVGECRKKVMGLYRLLGNKADVIKGFAKRCNEQWDVAPRSEIGLYLGDIQDHIVTMTGNLSHYENLLSRAHSNYLAQINIRMNERQEKTSDILGKLTVLGTIVLPMNIVTGMWGMNVLVPGQDGDTLYWFWGITMGLLMFGFGSFFIAKRVYGIV
ncbi:cora-domain-containing protein [Lepidopterella palustris CBS 459.81]|uniref:Cora-domain-containing protein n=1 Tax=Lepidopterella palustris CBS 459.81 TaxID=1314670 RepID=A0A8E2JGL6_9PEZI|nr:cora-domain-containing protein [Lepidopterella palustris CBS 459.81]